MDKTTIKMVLSAYRPDHRDGADPVFAEALQAVERDPELAAWFEQEQRFDLLVGDTLRQVVPAPADLKELILLNARSTAQPDRAAWRRQAGTWLAMAASLVLAFALGRQTLPGAAPPPAAGNGGGGANRLALQAIAYSGKMPALQFVCFDSALVARWIDEKSAALSMGKVIEKSMANLQMIGSSTARFDDKPVILIALQNGSQMAMLYVVRAADFPDAASGAGTTMEKDGWVSETGRDGQHLYVLTAKGTRKNLHFAMPL